jgi:hypothetical protein
MLKNVTDLSRDITPLERIETKAWLVDLMQLYKLIADMER